jgi:hypothetical protein
MIELLAQASSAVSEDPVSCEATNIWEPAAPELGTVESGRSSWTVCKHSSKRALPSLRHGPVKKLSERAHLQLLLERTCQDAG